MSNFYRWFADESAKLARYIRAKKRAEAREKEAFERFQSEGRGKYPRDDGRKTVRLAFSLRVLKKNLAHKAEEASAQIERRFMSSIVDTQRELLVQAWHVHVARAIKRVGNDPESYTVRKTWRELAGAYAVLCLVDGFDLVRENMDIGFMLCRLGNWGTARTTLTTMADLFGGPDNEDYHGF